jgi:hypothetical protein
VTRTPKGPAKRRSGPTQPESRRRAGQVLLRLTAEQRDALDALAAAWECTRSAAVVRLTREALR